MAPFSGFFTNLGLWLLLITLLLAGCAANQVQSENLRGKVDVFGVELHSTVDHRVVKGVKATEEPCLKGYDRIFDELDVVVGYGFDRRIRRITSRNPHTSMFGVKPGLSLDEGRRLLIDSGFAEDASPYSFTLSRYTVKLLVNSANSIFGITLESLD